MIGGFVTHHWGGFPHGSSEEKGSEEDRRQDCEEGREEEIAFASQLKLKRREPRSRRFCFGMGRRLTD